MLAIHRCGRVSVPERAILELASDIGNGQSLEEASNLMVSLRYLRADVLDEFLSHRPRVKVSGSSRCREKMAESAKKWPDNTQAEMIGNLEFDGDSIALVVGQRAHCSHAYPIGQKARGDGNDNRRWPTSGSTSSHQCGPDKHVSRSASNVHSRYIVPVSLRATSSFCSPINRSV